MDLSYESRRKLTKYDSKLYNTALETCNYISSREWNFHLVYTFAAYIYAAEYQQVSISTDYCVALLSIVVTSGLHVSLIVLYKIALQNKFHPWRYMLWQIISTFILNTVAIIISLIFISRVNSDNQVPTECIRQYWFIFMLYAKTIYVMIDIQFNMRLLTFVSQRQDDEYSE
jgi:hypothetical protein